MWSSLSITDHTALTMVTLDLDLAAVAESHQPIVDAIAAGDVALACRVSREHQAWFVELLEETAGRSAPAEAQAEQVAEPEPLPSA
jgi:DNA-binding GntR family transcriptional regulator